MSFWKWLGEVSYTLEAAEATAEKKREARRKERLEALKYTFANLVTRNEFHRRVNDLGTGISQIFNTIGIQIVTKVNEISIRHTNDLGKVICLKLDDIEMRIKDFIARGENLIKVQVRDTVIGALSGIEKAADHRQHATNALVMEQAKQANVVANQHQVELLQRFQELKQLIEPTQANGQPTVEWLAENADNIIELGDSFKSLRDGTIPASPAMVQVVRAVRALIEVDMKSVKQAVDTQAELWGVGQTELAQAA